MIGRKNKNRDSESENLQYSKCNKHNTLKTYPQNAKILNVKF